MSRNKPTTRPTAPAITLPTVPALNALTQEAALAAMARPRAEGNAIEGSDAAARVEQSDFNEARKRMAAGRLALVP